MRMINLGATPKVTVYVTQTVTVTVTSIPSSATPSGSLTRSVIPMSAACKWAYPEQATGQFSGSGYSIVCLGANGLVLGGFNDAHSLNAWCLDNHHTGGANLPDPQLSDGTWYCVGGAPAPPPPATSQPPAPGQSPAPSRPPVTSAPPPPPSPSPTARPSAVAIPLGAACTWAYPGKASGQFSGSNYSIVCLGTAGQVLGGFGGAHSLNAWCADPSHTGGKPLPSPALVNGEWLCTP
jgi:hypothetical protein